MPRAVRVNIEIIRVFVLPTEAQGKCGSPLIGLDISSLPAYRTQGRRVPGPLR